LHGKPHAPERFESAILRSIEEKAGDSRETNARFFADQGTTLVAAWSVADVYRGGGRLISMGDGGSGEAA
jgi:D-sedoheptulose 7-phosphate isomerase